MIGNAISHLIQHWKTSLAGGVLGPAVFAALQGGCGKTTWTAYGLGAAVALLGFIAKDPGAAPKQS